MNDQPEQSPAPDGSRDHIKSFGWSVFLIFALIVIDQTVKIWVETYMEYHQQIDLLPVFALFRTHNTGVAFSMLSDLGPGALTLMSLAISAFVLWLLWRTPRDHGVARLGYMMIIAGAIGNLIDRATLGYVVDYFLFHTENWSFAVFNLADSFITIGAALAVLQEVLIWRASTRPQP
ncbi:signal peptidase II [Notoacmeibacter sp. MSK16QG-6]|uniref:signal peptidase II n=1 Tax=Notoacmeibacter sp. MSK16QG-6 TaxID=2957982 RepID=UPI00209E7C39|nr:signal peptidase II [Notoacmeibacter sp. MSK16QG-6]MCP1198908.1 signal peptidase II [Notoacmeibacter sp. MSK16QG-6]